MGGSGFTEERFRRRPPCYLPLNQYTLGVNKFNKTPLLIACFFFVICFRKNSKPSLIQIWVFPGVLECVQTVMGVSFHYVNCFCCNILSVRCKLAVVSVESVIVYFCIIFYGMGDRLAHKYLCMYKNMSM